MNLELSPELQAFRQEVRLFIEEHLTDELRAGQSAASGLYPEPEFSTPWQRLLQAKGWLVPLWPKEWGGTGWSGMQRFIFENECALAGAPLVHPMGVRLVGPVLIRFGTDEQKRQFLPGILSSEDYWCQGFSEPGAGSDLASLSLKAVRDGDDYVLNGSKIWTTHAQHANWMFALVRTSSEGKRQSGISFILVDMRSPGITVRPISTIGGDHDVNEVFFDSVRVPAANIVGGENNGWECAKYLLEFERGAGIFSPRLRSQLGRAVAALQESANMLPDVATRLGNVSADLDAFEWLEVRTLAELRPGENPGDMSSVLKLRASRLKQDIAQFAVEALSTSALRWRSPSEPGGTLSRQSNVLVPEYCNSRANTIFGGATEIQLGLIARNLVGV